jgi:cyclophilin family peptidyl-prolyl cis-trans isomerase
MQKIALFLIAAAIAFSAQAQNPQVEVKTSAGNFTVELYQDKAPKTVANFLQYAQDGFYNGTIFHRVIDGFMVQGGGFDRDMKEKPITRPRLQNEASAALKNTTGTLAMARTSDPHSATAQFFVNVKDNDFLNFREPSQQGYGYAVFGKVVEGMDVVMRIAKTPTATVGPHQNVPRQPIVIESIAARSNK